MQKISVVISAYNEQEKIEECLKSVKWADEIVVMDNSSTDNTPEIAKRMGAMVYVQPNNPLHIDLQKNTGIKKAINNWILLVDADEIVTEELKVEIKKIIEEENLKNGYFIPRKNIIFGKQIDHSGWYPDYQLRLFKKNTGEFKSGNVHEQISIDGETGHLKEHILHHNYESVNQFIQRNMINYAQIQAETLISENYKVTTSDLIEKPMSEFFGRFFARKGYKDGLHGLFLALLLSAAQLVVLAYVWERHGFEKKSEKEVVGSLDKGFKELAREAKYWLITSKIVETKSPFKKIGYKLKRKIG